MVYVLKAGIIVDLELIRKVHNVQRVNTTSQYKTEGEKSVMRAE